jgi:hypothetical protein
LKFAAKISIIFYITLYWHHTHKIDYYLSQPRDTDLNGWWVSKNQGIDSMFFNFQQEAGEFLIVEYNEGIYSEHTFKTYWFTKKDGDKNILYRFEKHGSLYGSAEYKNFYKVVNDSLWKSSLLGNWDDPELTFWGVRTIAPEGYEHVK